MDVRNIEIFLTLSSVSSKRISNVPVMHGHRGGGGGGGGPDPLKITKLPSQRSMLGHHWHASKRHLNGVLLVGQ